MTTKDIPLTAITLRDWFAGQALAGIAATMTEDDRCATDWSFEATDAYRAADAMLVRRGKP